MIKPLVEILQSEAESLEKNLTTADLAMLVLGSLPDLLRYFARMADHHQVDPVVPRRVFAGIEVVPQIVSLSFADDLPPWSRDRVLAGVSDICSVLGDWTIGLYGQKPTESDLIEVQELLQWAARGALWARVRPTTEKELKAGKEPFKTGSILDSRGVA